MGLLLLLLSLFDGVSAQHEIKIKIIPMAKKGALRLRRMDIMIISFQLLRTNVNIAENRNAVNALILALNFLT